MIITPVMTPAERLVFDKAEKKRTRNRWKMPTYLDARIVFTCPGCLEHRDQPAVNIEPSAVEDPCWGGVTAVVGDTIARCELCSQPVIVRIGS